MQLKKLPFWLLAEFPNPYRVTLNMFCPMNWRIPFTSFALTTGLFVLGVPSIAQKASADDYRVLSKEEVGLSLTTVEAFIKDGEKLFQKGNYEKARKKFDQARDMSKLLLSFYGDISSSFKGLDVRIPREMDSNSRKVLTLLSKANLRLAALFRKTDQPELAVPLLIEVVRIISPSNEDGQKAYQQLVQLGFVETPFRGARKRF